MERETRHERGGYGAYFQFCEYAGNNGARTAFGAVASDCTIADTLSVLAVESMLRESLHLTGPKANAKTIDSEFVLWPGWLTRNFGIRSVWATCVYWTPASNPDEIHMHARLVRAWSSSEATKIAAGNFALMTLGETRRILWVQACAPPARRLWWGAAILFVVALLFILFVSLQ